MRVLAVDDEVLNTRALKRALSGSCSVRTANTLEEALSALAAEQPDVLIADFDLGGGATSLALFRAVTHDYPMVRRVLYSASRPELWVTLVDEALIDAAVPKPASLEELLAAFRPAATAR